MNIPGMDEPSETHAVCAYCGRRVDPNGAGVTYAIQRAQTPTLVGDAPSIEDGLGSYFHAGCSMAAAGYAERAKPQLG